MKSEPFVVSWVDLLILIVLTLGVVRGRKRGMSEELLDLIKWIVIVVGAAFCYEPVGQLLASSSVFSLLSCYVATYTMILLLTLLFFSFVKHGIGQKLVGSDVFGASEYYLGMIAGSIRYACVLMAVMAILNARYFSPEEVNSQTQYQEDNFGTKMFPTLVTLQAEVFGRSYIGRFTREYLGVALIKPTAPEEKGLGGRTGSGSAVKARESAVDNLIEKKR